MYLDRRSTSYTSSYSNSSSSNGGLGTVRIISLVVGIISSLIFVSLSVQKYKLRQQKKKYPSAEELRALAPANRVQVNSQSQVKDEEDTTSETGSPYPRNARGQFNNNNDIPPAYNAISNSSNSGQTQLASFINTQPGTIQSQSINSQDLSLTQVNTEMSLANAELLQYPPTAQQNLSERPVNPCSFPAQSPNTQYFVYTEQSNINNPIANKKV